MAKWKAVELEEITDMLSEFGDSWRAIAKEALYDGRKVMREALEREVDNIPTTAKDKYYPDFLTPIRTIRPAEKEGLKQGIRIYKMKSDVDGVSVAVGFEGYNERGRPNSLIARSLVKGTSVVQPNRFVDRAFNSSIKKCEEVIGKKVEYIATKTFSK